MIRCLFYGPELQLNESLIRLLHPDDDFRVIKSSRVSGAYREPQEVNISWPVDSLSLSLPSNSINSVELTKRNESFVLFLFNYPFVFINFEVIYLLTSIFSVVRPAQLIRNESGCLNVGWFRFNSKFVQANWPFNFIICFQLSFHRLSLIEKEACIWVLLEIYLVEIDVFSPIWCSSSPSSFKFASCISHEY